jgi:predicted transcriptional regulator
MTESRNRATDAEIERRRAQALRLRFARLSEPEIAERLGVSPATVSRDLQVVHQTWGERFQTHFDLGRELVEAVLLFEILEGAAVKQLVRLEGEADSGATAIVKCVLAAAELRTRRLNLFAAAGLIGDSPVRTQTALPSAAEIRAAIESVRFEQLDIVPDVGRGWLHSSLKSPVAAVDADDAAP